MVGSPNNSIDTHHKGMHHLRNATSHDDDPAGPL
jgi:hypothetical protein